MYTKKNLEDFVRESNKIEGIERDPSQEEIDTFARFMTLPKITIDELIHFVSIYQPDAKLRDQIGLDVRVGSYIPPWGDPNMRMFLQNILDNGLPSYYKHIMYEKLHPFTDCNGRSGRALWAWQERDLSLGFLHKFYYQTLKNGGKG